MLERLSFFETRKEFLYFLALCGFILFYSLLIEFNEYKKLIRFDSQISEAIVLKQYTKSKNNKTFTILKLRTDDGLNFFTNGKKNLVDLRGKKLKLEIWAGKISFYEYLTTFYAYSKILYTYKIPTLKQKLNQHLNSQHVDKNIANIYQALYTATPLHVELQKTFSTLGISHLLAISGFHLGVLSGLLFLFLKPLYSFFQDRFFPYRNSKTDIFLIVLAVLFGYLVFLDTPPSLLRAFIMFFVGFILYDRYFEVISMQTLLVSVLLILSFFPKLIFSLGLWLSVSGVFYIFLFLLYFKHKSKLWQFILVPFWVYLLMLPFSLAIFGNFSLLHPLSILWTTLFTLFYPFSILLHLIGYADLFDNSLLWLISLGKNSLHVEISYTILALHVAISLASVFYKKVVWALILESVFIFVYAIYQIT